MTRITLVAALDRLRVIGHQGSLPWHLPEDLAHFKALTTGHPMLMGRRTFDAIGRVLPGRRTIVLTRAEGWRHEGVEVVSSWAQARALVSDAAELFVVGGGEVYTQTLPHADRMVLTEVEGEHPGDTWFPEWDPQEWQVVRSEPHAGFRIVTYDRAPTGPAGRMTP